MNNDNPYESNSWNGGKWHCIRCGSILEPIAKDDKGWGYCWETMLKDKTLYFLCSNKNCCHRDAPLILHHPVYGWRKPAGDSYSISWVE